MSEAKSSQEKDIDNGACDEEVESYVFSSEKLRVRMLFRCLKFIEGSGKL